MSNKVQLADQATEFIVEEDETILEAALRQNHQLSYGCRNGLCGSCKALVETGRFYYPGTQPEAISEEETAQGYALLCQARAKTDLRIRARTVDTSADVKARILPSRVVSCEKLNDNIMRVKLALLKTGRLQFLAGQYIDILMREGKRRSFSLANPPHEDQLLELHIRYYRGGLFSEYAFHDLRENALLRIEGPLGQFTLQKSDRPMIMIAGGTGFAPVKSLVEHALNNNDKRSIAVYRGARTRAELYLNDIPKKWAKEFDHITYTPVLSDMDRLDGWQGRTGLVHQAVLEDYPDLSGYDVYTCGPPPMVDAVVGTLPGHGLDRQQLFSDSFEFAAR